MRGAPLQTAEEREAGFEAETESQPERIVAAALRTPKGIVVSLPKPARHWNVIHHMGENGYTPVDIARCDQGFVTDQGRWLRRAPALRFALKTGQVTAEGHTHPRELFSEDVW